MRAFTFIRSTLSRSRSGSSSSGSASSSATVSPVSLIHQTNVSPINKINYTPKYFHNKIYELLEHMFEDVCSKLEENDMYILASIVHALTGQLSSTIKSNLSMLSKYRLSNYIIDRLSKFKNALMHCSSISDFDKITMDIIAIIVNDITNGTLNTKQVNYDMFIIQSMIFIRTTVIPKTVYTKAIMNVLNMYINCDIDSINNIFGNWNRFAKTVNNLKYHNVFKYRLNVCVCFIALDGQKSYKYSD